MASSRVYISLLLLSLIVLMLVTGCNMQREGNLIGTVLKDSPKAMDFKLVDQFGGIVKLSDYSDKVIMLTFLFTSCNDICPLVAHHLRETHNILVGETNDIVTLVVSVDPDRDTVINAHKFLEDYGMVDKWKYLVGTEKDLQTIWQAYYVSPGFIKESNIGEAVMDTDGLQQSLITTYSIQHQAPVYVIDRAGNIRSMFTLPFDPKDLANDVRVLSK